MRGFRDGDETSAIMSAVALDTGSVIVHDDGNPPASAFDLSCKQRLQVMGAGNRWHKIAITLDQDSHVVVTDSPSGQPRGHFRVRNDPDLKIRSFNWSHVI